MEPEFQTALRIASYNIRAGLGTDLRRDPARTLRAIAALKADIVTLQEADFRMGARPSALPRDLLRDMTGLVPVAGDDRSLGWHGIALLVRPDIVAQDVHRLDLPSAEPRGAVVVDLLSALGPIRVVGVHLGLLRRSRRRQLDYVRDFIGGLAPMPTVIAGDFNERSTRVGLGRIAQDFTILPAARTFPSTLPLLPLDRIAHCDQLQVRMEPVPKMPAPHPSDHRPIVAAVTARPMAGSRRPDPPHSSPLPR
ncbi:endonuclease/exonuclease/phosphatase family protein [Octadecabacter sp. R77987]|uniref:endonuclease/exonuclease/phosphatase family protein n=1 Tax=Octadecabacter sp. R77987 TaxID=3093874 RepID=UPI00366C5036